MTRKCGFFDCNNLAEQETNRCQKCEMRKENMDICSACRQPEPQEDRVLDYEDSFFKIKEAYKAAVKMRDKSPAQFKSEIDQLLPQFKLSAAEKEQIDKLEKVIR